MNAGLIGAVTMALAVGLGAFGAHGLKNSLTPEALNWWDVGVRYQVWHALGLIGLGLAGSKVQTKWAVRSGYAFLLGIILFSGSLYALALSQMKILGAITPFGGLSFIFGWVCFALAFARGAGSHPEDSTA